jgi:hypothetical protein
LYIEDVEAAPGQRGRAALQTAYEDMIAADQAAALFVTSHVIDLLSSDDAHGVVYCYCETGDGANWIRQLIAYEDTYRRVDGRWFFVSRSHELIYGVEVEDNPLTQPPAHWSRSNVGRDTVPYEWPTWGRGRSG